MCGRRSCRRQRGRAAKVTLPSRTIHRAGPTTSTTPPIASAATPSAVSATPPSSASPAPVRPESRSLNPSSLPRSHDSLRSASSAVAATNDRFHPRPRPNSATAVAGTLDTHRRLATDSAMSSRPPASDGVRPTRSTTSPATITSAYIPTTCAPMIGKTLCAAWWKWSTTTAPVSVITATITAKLACAASTAGMTPGRRRSSPNGAAGGLVASGSSRAPARASSAAIRRGSGRTASTSASPTSMNAPAASHNGASASPSRSRPASSGLNTSGPRTPRKTAPNRTSAMPRARRSGGYMSPAAVRASSAVPLAAPTAARPSSTKGAEPRTLPTAASAQPTAPAQKPDARTGTRPTRSIAPPAGSAGEHGWEDGSAADGGHGAARRQRRERARGEHDRRAEPEQPARVEDEHERQRRHGGGELQHRGVRGERRREQHGVAADRKLLGHGWASLDRAQQRRHDRRDDDAPDHRPEAPRDEAPGGDAHRVRADREPVAIGERLCHDERREQRGRQEDHDAREPQGQLAPAERKGPDPLDDERDDGTAADQGHRAAHPASAAAAARADECRPTSAARLAASTGTPPGAIGTSTSAIRPPSTATSRDRRSPNSSMSSARKNAG